MGNPWKKKGSLIGIEKELTRISKDFFLRAAQKKKKNYLKKKKTSNVLHPAPD